MTMNTRALVAALSLMLLGVVLGVAGDRLWLAHQRPMVVLDSSHAERFHTLLGTLGLSDEQRAAIDGILGHFQQNVDHTWQALQPDLAATMDSAQQRIEAVLTPAQVTTFREWLETEHQMQHGATHRGLH
jgi:hypothetical protein